MTITPDARAARTLRVHTWLHAALGVIGLVFALYLIYPKALGLINGDPRVLGRGAVANVALLLGSLMFLRNARRFRRSAEALKR